jgi:hypothetical protein
MDLDAPYISLLVVSVALTFLVGRLLITAGEPFLQEVFQDAKVTRSVNLLLSVLFHLITLGVLAIISGIDLGPAEPLQRWVTRLGVVLLVLGVAYGISMLVLIRIRERRRQDEISEHVQERLAERAGDTRPSAETGAYPPPHQPDGAYPPPHQPEGAYPPPHQPDGVYPQPHQPDGVYTQPRQPDSYGSTGRP